MENNVTLIGWNEFADALGIASDTMQGIFENAAMAMATAVRSGAQTKVKKRTGALMDSIIAEAIPGGAQTTVMEIYGVYVEEGTGMYDPRGAHTITAKNGGVMAWKAANGDMVFARSTKGMKAQPFFWPAVDDAKMVLAEQLATGLDEVVNMLADK